MVVMVMVMVVFVAVRMMVVVVVMVVLVVWWCSGCTVALGSKVSNSLQQQVWCHVESKSGLMHELGDCVCACLAMKAQSTMQIVQHSSREHQIRESCCTE